MSSSRLRPADVPGSVLAIAQGGKLGKPRILIAVVHWLGKRLYAAYEVLEHID
jgi:hypothetical protein